MEKGILLFSSKEAAMAATAHLQAPANIALRDHCVEILTEGCGSGKEGRRE